MRLLSLLCFATVAWTTAYAGTAVSNSHWPLTVGNRWLFVDPETRSPTVMTVQNGPKQFGCVPLTDLTAQTPIELDIVKLHPGNYWQPGTAYNLRFLLTVPQPSSLPFGVTGDVLSIGWIAEDYSTGMPGVVRPGGITNVVTLGTVPTYRLIQADGRTGQYATLSAYIDVRLTESDQCAIYSPVSSTRRWTSEWRTTALTVPGFSGTVVDSYYLEDSGSYQGRDNKEHWYFAKGIGPVRIEAIEPDTQRSIKSLDLIAFEPGNGQPVSSHVTLKDVLLAYAGSTAARPYAAWASIFSGATKLRAPDARESCLPAQSANLPMTIDQFLAQIETTGSASCDLALFPAFVNGQSTDSIIALMQSSGDHASLRNFDQWNFAYSAVTASRTHPPESACMTTVKTDEIPNILESVSVVPLRWAEMTARQWLLFHNASALGCVKD